MIIGILLTVLLLSILVLVHEFGHFIAAKLMGIRVIEFALFMGPKIFSFKKGETTYSLRCIPLGGFCSMEGEEKTSEDDRAFSNKPWYQKALVLIAGPAMNIFLAIFLTIVLFLTNGYSSLAVGDVIPGSAAYELGISEGDRIVALNGMGVSSALELSTYEMMYAKDQPFTYTVKKANGEKVEVTGGKIEHSGIRTKVYHKTEHEKEGLFIQEVIKDSQAQEAGIETGDQIIQMNEYGVRHLSDYYYYRNQIQGTVTYKIQKPSGQIIELAPKPGEKAVGITMISYEKGDQRSNGVITLVGDSLRFTVSLIKVTVKSLVWIVTGKASADDVAGPVGMVSIVNDTVSKAGSFTSGLVNLIMLAILISVNLGVFNILPFPALDGGRLVFAIVEGVRGKKLKPEHEGVVSLVGFVVLIGLSILIFINDIVKLFR